jgi:hypothetical protein
MAAHFGNFRLGEGNHEQDAGRLLNRLHVLASHIFALINLY